MKALTVVWNKAGDECVGFTDPADARYASGKKLSGLQHICGVSTLAEAFRETYDEGIKLEDVVVLDTAGLQVFKDLQECLVGCLTGGEISAKRAGKTIEAAAKLLEGLK